MKSQTTPLVYTVNEAADELKISRAYLYRLISSNQIGYVKVGGCTRIRPKDLEKYIEIIEKKHSKTCIK